jgi:phosphoribosylanthranilate isomerase
VDGRVKICGLCRREDVLAADEAGADYLGVVLTGGFSRSVEPDRAAEFLEGVRAQAVAVLVDEEAGEAVRLALRVGAGVVQLHGEESPEVVAAVAAAGPWAVWKAVRVRGADDLEGAVARYGAVADGLLLEGWREGVTGGGGARLAGTLASRAGEAIQGAADFVLAGGLGPANVFDAVARFRPDVVDVSSGVEAAVRRKDPDHVHRFVSEARRAWRTRPNPVPSPRSGADP